MVPLLGNPDTVRLCVGKFPADRLFPPTVVPTQREWENSLEECPPTKVTELLVSVLPGIGDVMLSTVCAKALSPPKKIPNHKVRKHSVEFLTRTCIYKFP